MAFNTTPYYNPYVNPYQQYTPMQQPIYQPQQAPVINNPAQSISASIVDSFDNIPVNDVPMNNIGALFIKRDGKEIQHRVWDNMGNIRTTQYRLDTPTEITPEGNTTTDTLNMRYEAFNDALKHISDTVNDIYAKVDELSPKTKATARNKKEEVGE